MRIVDDSDIATLLGDEALEASVDSGELAQAAQGLFLRHTEEGRCRIYGEEVVDIEFADESHQHLDTCDTQLRAVGIELEDLRAVVSSGAQGVAVLMCPGILQHHGTVLVIGIRQRKGILAEPIEEALLSTEVLLHRAVIVEVVTREVREDTATEVHPSGTMLRHSVGADLHEDVRTARCLHTSKERLQLGGRGRSVRSGDGFVLDIVAHRAQEATAVARCTEEAEEKRGDGRLAIRPRDTDDLHRLRGVAVECRAGEPERLSRRADDDISDVRTLLLGERLDEDGTCTRLDSGGDEAMPISMDTA